LQAVKKKRFVAESSTMFDGADPTLPRTSVVENTPLRPVEGMIRAEDPGEWQKPIEVEDGRARNLANSLNTTPGAEENNSNGEASSLQGKLKVCYIINRTYCNYVVGLVNPLNRQFI